MTEQDSAVVPVETFSAAALTDVASTVLKALGTPADLARTTAASLAAANELGHDSHGVIRLLQYSAWVEQDQIRPAARATVVRRRGSTATVDGAWGLGQPAATLATRTAIELQDEHGIGAVVVSRCNHVGRLGEYVETLADRGCIGLALCNSGPIVAPQGGSRRTFGTNPLAWAAPVADGPALVLDFSTAGVAEGKVKVALTEGLQVPDGLIIDQRGRPTREPSDLYDGGALLPFGGHKGSGLSLMIELVGGLLSGMGAAPMPDYAGGNGMLLLALSVDAWTDLDAFRDAAAAFARRVVTGDDGERDDRILLPGELEQRTARRRRHEGIPVGLQTRTEVTRLAHRLGVGDRLGTFAVD